MGIRKERAAGTEAALKQAARELFATRGFSNTKIVDITAAAGRSTGVFYDHFTSKEELLAALLADMHDAGHDHFGMSEEQHHDLTTRVALREHLALAWGIMRAHRPVMAALFESGLAEGPASGALWQR